ncbi:MAG: transglutaminase domain-containing protein, partial [Armatimonadetes bacterium]|nr:transglutaminase domain-containing protein [Armatimonadota bacterium]
MFRKGRRAFALVVAAALVMFVMVCCANRGPHRATAAQTQPVESWFAAYLQGQKIGYMSESIRPLAGQDRIEYVSKNYAALNVLGQSMEQTSVWVSTCDREFHPLDLQFTIESGGRTTAVVARFGERAIECAKTTGDNTVNSTVPIPEGVELVVDGQALVSQGRVDLGDELTVHQFNPVTLEIEPCTLKGVRREPLALAGETVDALLIHMVSPMIEADVWVDDAGRMLQLKSAMMQGSLEFRRVSREEATAALTEEGPRVDLVVATAIRPNQPIDNPQRTARLVLDIQGLEKLKRVPTDAWQQVSPRPGGGHRVTIDTAAAPRPAELSLPLTRSGAPGVELAELEEYLKPSSYIESDHPEMLAKAKEILAGERDVPRAMTLIHDYVQGRIRWQANIGLFRSALEILRDPAGVCRDSAALYTALARAAGIPTRVCAGLVYVNGAFMGHAWAESWCGGWLAVDATTAGMFVNATHLKLAQGSRYTCVFEMLPALGSLSINVVEQTALQP